jgi:hypothetical protein
MRQRCVVPDDEIQVYAAFFQGESYEKATDVLVDRTTVRSYGIDELNLRLAANGHGLPPELRADFTSKSKVACTVRPSPLLSNLKLISAREEAAMPSGLAFWGAFHRRYGKDATIYSVSRAGFTRDQNLALVFLSAGIAANGAATELCLLEKKDGRWQIKLQMQVGGV